MSWVPAEMTQCEDRLHRIGTRNNVLVQHLVLEGSLDAIMIRRLIAKQDILSGVLESSLQRPPFPSPGCLADTAETAEVARRFRP